MPNLCKICTQPTRTITVEADGKQYHWCAECEFIALYDEHMLSPEVVKDRYARHENTMDNEGYVAMFERFIAASIAPYAVNPRTVLEFGCGPGPVLAELLRRRGLTVDVFDPCFAPDPVYEHKMYDVITATEVFEHVSDPVTTLALLVQHLAPGGIIALMTRFHSNDEKQFAKWWYRRDDTHVAFYTTTTMHTLAEQLGIRMVYGDHEAVCVLGRKG